jgi:ankyrin repeat protein
LGVFGGFWVFSATPSKTIVLPDLASLVVGADAVHSTSDESEETDKAWHLTEELFKACSNGHDQDAADLLAQGAEVNGEDVCRATALHHACENGRTGCVRLLLAYGANVNARNDNEDTPLHTACSRGNVGCARLLVENEADVNAQNEEGLTPLHRACSHNRRLRCVRLLLEVGAKTRLEDEDRDTPLECANLTGSYACALLVERARLLRQERGVPAGAPLTLDWTESTHDLLRPSHRALLDRAVGALLLVDARREGGVPLGREGALAFVAGLARVMGV